MKPTYEELEQQVAALRAELSEEVERIKNDRYYDNPIEFVHRCIGQRTMERQPARKKLLKDTAAAAAAHDAKVREAAMEEAAIWCEVRTSLDRDPDPKCNAARAEEIEGCAADIRHAITDPLRDDDRAVADLIGRRHAAARRDGMEEAAAICKRAAEEWFDSDASTTQRNAYKSACLYCADAIRAAIDADAGEDSKANFGG